jgi:hypothetical protein
MAAKTKKSSKGNKAANTTHIAMPGRGSAFCGAKGKMGAADSATCAECKKIAARVEEKFAAKAKAQETEGAAETAATTVAKPESPRQRDPRLPAPGTVLQKKNRQGSVRCECTIEDDGIRYKGELFRSLSAAAMAASKDLGLGGRAMNGFLFWGLVRQQPRPKDPMAALDRAWERYHERVKALATASLDDEIRKRISSALERQGREIVEVASSL